MQFTVNHPKVVTNAESILSASWMGGGIDSRISGNGFQEEAAFFCAGEIELTVGLAFADIAAMIKLPVDGVYVAVEDQRSCMQSARGRCLRAGSRG